MNPIAGRRLCRKVYRTGTLARFEPGLIAQNFLLCFATLSLIEKRRYGLGGRRCSNIRAPFADRLGGRGLDHILRNSALEA